jgi:DNA repair protein RecN (Recombination protein N)
MLTYLRVENLAVVEKAELSFSPQFNVLTGETGAGKSILINAIQLLSGKKFSDTVIRTGAERVVVEALFAFGETEVVLKREIEPHKSLAFIDNRVVPFGQLKEKADSFFNIYGQRDHGFLLHAANHQTFLDEFSQHDPLLEQLAEKYRTSKKLHREWNDLNEKNTQAGERLAYLNFQLQEIENLNLKREDEEAWNERAKILAAAETIIGKANSLMQEFYLKEQSVYNTLAQNRSHVEYLQSMFADFIPLRDEIERFYKFIPELSSYLNGLVGRLEYNENELNELEEKLLKLNKLKAKFKSTLDQILERYEEMKAERNFLLQLNFSLADKEKEIAGVLGEYRELLGRLRENRNKNASVLSGLIVKELSRLEMKKAVFEVRFEEIEPTLDNLGEKGTDKIEFFFSSNPGQPAGRLSEVASGGELSRLMLVLKSIIRDETESTYIFDEIDAGIGGKTAEFVGEKLKRISAANQVICISHLPQIASFADRHFLITKEIKDNQTFSSAKILSRAERIKEIARLMAGTAINADVLKAAQGLLDKDGA